MFREEVRAHNPTASGTSLVACSRAHPVSVMCAGLPLCARHIASLPCWQSPADCRRPCTSSSALYRHDDGASAVHATLYHRGPGISSGSSSSLEQSAACDESRQLTPVVSARDKSASFSPVVSELTRYLLSTILLLLASAHDILSKIYVQCPCSVVWCDSVTLIFSSLIIIIILSTSQPFVLWRIWAAEFQPSLVRLARAYFCFSGCRSWCSALMPFLFVTIFVQETHRTSGHPSSFYKV